MQAKTSDRLLDVVNRVAKEELESERWLKQVAQRNGRSLEEMGIIALECLDMDVLSASVGSCALSSIR
jgi:hypothetical protein